MLFIAVATFIVVVLVLHLIKRTFDNFKIEKINLPFKLNVKSDKIIILSKKGCPWCEKLNPYIDYSRTECVKITVNDDDTFKFDERFTNLKQVERESIIKGSKDLLENTGYHFPTIIYNNEYIIGFPEEKTLNKLFNQ
jgi:glutaredoxin